MKILNKYNLPEYFLHMSDKNYRPDPTHMSTTDLPKPPLLRSLYIDHFDELSQDVSERFKMMHGIAWDEFCKKHCRWALTNIRIEIPFDDFTLICKPDYYHVLDHVLADFKEKSVWNINNYDPTNIWNKQDIAQVNTYCWAMNFKTKLPIDKLELHIYGRDWRPGEKLRYGHNYSDIAFKVVDVPHWTTKEQADYIDAQMKDHKLNPYRECSDEEKMVTKDQFAVHKTGRKSALRVLDSSKEAMQWCKEKGHTVGEGGIYINRRKGEAVRCSSYCSVSQHCKYMKGKKNV